MIDKINDSIFVNQITGVQTRILYDRYCNDFPDQTINIQILESVNIMTPENIHLNSFMYEPILDMGIGDLRDLYKTVKENLKIEN